jgi:hypothetical protein
MSEEKRKSDRLEQVREIFRELELEPRDYDPELARTYAGQWIVIHRGRVIAHGSKGSELIEAGYLRKNPGSRLEYVPTLDQQEGVWILPLAASDG